MTLTNLFQAHSDGTNCGALRAVASRLRRDNNAEALADTVDELHSGLQEASLAYRDTAEEDAAFWRGFHDGYRAFDKPMTPAEAAGTLAALVLELHYDVECAA